LINLTYSAMSLKSWKEEGALQCFQKEDLTINQTYFLSKLELQLWFSVQSLRLELSRSLFHQAWSTSKDKNLDPKLFSNTEDHTDHPKSWLKCTDLAKRGKLLVTCLKISRTEWEKSLWQLLLTTSSRLFTWLETSTSLKTSTTMTSSKRMRFTRDSQLATTRQRMSLNCRKWLLESPLTEKCWSFSISTTLRSNFSKKISRCKSCWCSTHWSDWSSVWSLFCLGKLWRFRWQRLSVFTPNKRGSKLWKVLQLRSRQMTLKALSKL